MKVHFAPEVRTWFGELENVLYEMDYFSFKESARSYARKLFCMIHDNLPTRSSKPAPPYFGKGLSYASFRMNRRTTWYALFSKHEGAEGEIVYLVHRMENNHTAAQFM